MRKVILVAFVAAVLALPVLAQNHHAGHGAPQSPVSSASTKGYEDANAKMHKEMTIRYTGNADVDFARGMIPHHQGALDMARVVLQHGKDPEIRKLAQEVIASQEKEIAFLREWLKKNGK